MDKDITKMSLKEYCEATRVEGLEDFEIKILETYISAKIMDSEISVHKSYRRINEINKNNKLILNNLKHVTELTLNHSILETSKIT